MDEELAFEGLKVLDLSQGVAAPYCGMLLADMGANVIKIEKPKGGDDSRRMGPPFINGESAAFLAMNRNKRSLVLDLKQSDGRAIFRRLAARADVLVENFRPGTMEKHQRPRPGRPRDRHVAHAVTLYTAPAKPKVVVLPGCSPAANSSPSATRRAANSAARACGICTAATV